MTPFEVMNAVLAHVESRVRSSQWAIDEVSAGVIAPTVQVAPSKHAMDPGAQRVHVQLLRTGWQGRPDVVRSLTLHPSHVKVETLGATLDGLYRELGT